MTVKLTSFTSKFNGSGFAPDLAVQFNVALPDALREIVDDAIRTAYSAGIQDGWHAGWTAGATKQLAQDAKTSGDDVTRALTAAAAQGAPAIAALVTSTKLPTLPPPMRRLIERDADGRITGAVDVPA